jgi:hypothetical protein
MDEGSSSPNFETVGERYETRLLAPFYTKNAIVLPRQARDKHGEGTQNRDAFSCSATLYLVTNDCIAWSNASGRESCSPWDSDGVVHRGIVKMPVVFK